MKSLLESINEGSTAEAYGERKPIAQIVKDRVKEMTDGYEPWSDAKSIKYLTELVTTFYEEFGTRSSFVWNEPDNVEDIQIRVNRREDYDGSEFTFNAAKKTFE